MYNLYNKISNWIQFGEFKTDEEFVSEQLEALNEEVDGYLDEYIMNILIDLSNRVKALEEVIELLVIKTPKEYVKKTTKTTKTTKRKK